MGLEFHLLPAGVHHTGVEAAGLRLPWGSALRLQGGSCGFVPWQKRFLQINKTVVMDPGLGTWD